MTEAALCVARGSLGRRQAAQQLIEQEGESKAAGKAGITGKEAEGRVADWAGEENQSSTQGGCGATWWPTCQKKVAHTLVDRDCTWFGRIHLVLNWPVGQRKWYFCTPSSELHQVPMFRA